MPPEPIRLDDWEITLRLGDVRFHAIPFPAAPDHVTRDRYTKPEKILTSAILDCRGDVMTAQTFGLGTGSHYEHEESIMGLFDEGMRVRTQNGSTYLLGKRRAQHPRS